MFRLLSVLALAFLMFMPGVASAEEAKLARSISVGGHGEVQAVPDLATISMGVVTSSTTAKEALAANTKAMNELLEVLKKAGIDSKDIATSNFNVGPRYDYGFSKSESQPPKLVGYEVSNIVTVIVRKIDGMGDVLDAGVSAGSNQIHGISFSVSKPDAVLDEARKAAVADARRKAEIYAAAGGFALGQIISLSEGGGYQPPMPMAKTMAAEAAGAPPIAQGEQTLAIDVNVTWEIK